MCVNTALRFGTVAACKRVQLLFADSAYMMLSVELVAMCICMWAAREELEFRKGGFAACHNIWRLGIPGVTLELAAEKYVIFCQNRFLPVVAQT